MNSVKVRTPATSANLGPGFDCLGIALNVYNRLEIHEDDRLRIEIEGGGSNPHIPRDGSNLVYQSMKKAYEEAGKDCPNFFILQNNSIPLSRGLGSSAAAIVGGLLAANALMGAPFDKPELARMATSIEGHPDNVVPCIFGGLTAAVLDGGNVCYARTLPSSRYAYAAILPEYDLSTRKARLVLPESYSRADTVFNVGHAVMMYAALEQGLDDVLRLACRDRLHQPYRKAIVPGWDDINALAWDCGALAVFLSGAGPAVMAVYAKEDDGFLRKLEAGFPALTNGWKAMRLECSEEGASTKQGDTGHSHR
jgi:homoserine kinase